MKMSYFLEHLLKTNREFALLYARASRIWDHARECDGYVKQRKVRSNGSSLKNWNLNKGFKRGSSVPHTLTDIPQECELCKAGKAFFAALDPIMLSKVLGE